jgi:hypothetical protein
MKMAKFKLFSFNDKTMENSKVLSRKKLYEAEDVVFEFVYKGQYIHQTWSGFTSEENFSKRIEVLADLVKETKAKAVLVDVRNHRGLSPKSQKLALEYTLGFADGKLGFKVANVTSENIFSKLSIEGYTENLKNNNIESKYFLTVKEAQRWLEQ